MDYKAFYRTYRPSNFNEVVGQDHIVRTLVNLIKMNKISHGYLFCGPRGTGKTSIAKIFANAINCIHSEQPEQICQICLQNSNKTLDIIEIDAASNNSVNDIRTIREQVEFAPTNSPYKIYIIDEVHMLSKGAFNALLMTLEEPPKHAIFIFATTNPDKIPDTILSRVQRYNFKRISKNVLESQLKYVFEKENVKCDKDSIEMIATLANGSLRDALSIADQINAYSNSNITIDSLIEIFGLSTIEAQVHFLNLIANKLVSESLQYFDNLVNLGIDISRFIISLIELLKDYLVYESTKNISLVSTSVEMLEKIVFKKEMVYQVLDIFTPLISELKRSDIPQQLVQLSIIKICSSDDSMVDVSKKDMTSELLKTTALNLNTRTNLDLNNNKINQTKATHEISFSDTNKIDITQTHEFNQEYRDITDEYFGNDRNSKSEKIKTTEENFDNTKSNIFSFQNFDDLTDEKTQSKTLLNDFDNEQIKNDFDNLVDDFSLDEEINKMKNNFSQINEEQTRRTKVNRTIEEKLLHFSETTEPIDLKTKENDFTEKIINETTEVLNITNEFDASNREVNETILRNYDTSKETFDTNEINIDNLDATNESFSFKTPTNEINETVPINNTETKEFVFEEKKRKTETIPQKLDNVLSQPKIINLFLLSSKPTFEIFKDKLKMSTISEKEEYDSFAILLKETAFICSSNDFILVSSKEDWVINDINNKIDDKDFKKFIADQFGNNVHFFAITKNDYILSKELYAELKKSGRIPEPTPLKQINHIQDNDKIKENKEINEIENKSKALFGNIFSRKTEK